MFQSKSVYAILFSLVLLLLTGCNQPPAVIPGPDNLPSVLVSEYETVCTVEKDVAQFSSTIKLTALKDGWNSLWLLSPNFSITDYRVVEGEAEFAQLLRNQNGYEILFGKKGRYVLVVDSIIRVKDDKTGKSITVPFMPAVKNMARISIPEKELKVSISPALNYGTKPLGDKTEVFIFGAGGGEVSLMWQSLLPEKGIALVAFAEQKSLWTVSRGSIKVNSTIDYSILQGSMDSFSIELSADLNILDLTGDNIKKWDIKEEEGRKILTVVLSTPATKESKLKITAEKVLDNIPITVNAIKIAPLNVERERGFIAISTRKDIKVEVMAAKDIGQIDVGEMPPDIIAAGGNAALGFRYLRRPFELSLTLSDVDPKVTVDTLTIANISKDSVRLISTLFYTIRDSGVFHFSIKLEDGLRLIDLSGQNINNWQLKGNILSVDLRTKAEGVYVLKLELEKIIKDSQDVQMPSVEVLGVERERGFLGLSASMGVKIEVLSSEGISQINVKDMAPFFEKEETESRKQQEELLKILTPKYPIDVAFRYLKKPFKLAINVADVKPEIQADVETLYSIEEKKMVIDTAVTLHILKAGIFNLKVFLPKDLRIVSVDGASIDDWKRDEEKETLFVTFNSKLEGEYVLRIQTEKQLENVEQGLMLPRVEIFDVKKEKGFLAVESDTSLRVKTNLANLKKLTEVDIKDLPERLKKKSTAIMLAYKYFEHPWEVPLNVEKIKPYITAEAFNFLSFGEGLLSVSSTVKYDILYAGTADFSVQFPKGAKNVDIQGDNIKQKDEQKNAEEGDKWKISLHAPKAGVFQLYITYQRDVPEAKNSVYEKVECEGVKVLDVERETGYLAVAVRSDLEVSMQDENQKIENLTVIDETEIPAEYMTGITVPILLAAKYIQHNYELTFNIIKHDFADVMVAIIEGCMLYSTVSESGEMITDVVCSVRNSKQQQYLTIALPAKAQIWHVFVGAQSETPLKIDEGDKMVCAIPIAKEKRGNLAFEVRLRYSENVGALGKGGSVALKCPQLNISSMRVGWSLSLPEGYEVVADSGTMKRIAYSEFDDMLAKLTPDVTKQQEQMLNQPPVPNEQRQTNDRLNMGNTQAQNDVYVGQKMTINDKTGTATGLRAIYTGTTIKTGNTYLFQTLLALNRPMDVNVKYLKKNAAVILEGFILLILVGVLWFYWMGVKAFRQAYKLVTLAAMFLILLSAQALMERSYYELMSILTWTIGAVTVIFLLMHVRETLMAAGSGTSGFVASFFRRKQVAEEYSAPAETVQTPEVNETPAAPETPAETESAPKAETGEEKKEDGRSSE